MKKYKRMIYIVNDELLRKIEYMRYDCQLNISAVIRSFLEKKYEELTKNENK